MFDPGKVTFLSQNLPIEVKTQIEDLKTTKNGEEWVCLDLNGSPYKTNFKSYGPEDLKKFPSLKSSFVTIEGLRKSEDHLVWVDKGQGIFTIGKTNGEKIKGQSFELNNGKKLKVGLLKISDCKEYSYQDYPGLSSHLPNGRSIFQSSGETSELIKAIYFNKPIKRVWDLLSEKSIENLCIHFLSSSNLLEKWFQFHPGEFNQDDFIFYEIKVKPDQSSAFIDLFARNSKGITCYVHLALNGNRKVENEYYNFLRGDLNEIGIIFSRKFTNISKMPPNCVHIDLRELITFIKTQEPEQLSHITGIPSRFVA